MPRQKHKKATVCNRVRVCGEAALCEHVAIIIRPGKLVWQGDIKVLRDEGAIQFDGKEFRALEPLFPHLTGERYTDLNWL